MKEIKKLVEYIQDEIKGAENYAKCALKYKEEDRTLAETFLSIASQELSHIDTLHAQATRLITQAKNKGYQAPESMQAVWDWEHEKYIEHVAHIKTLIDMFRK